MNQIKTKPFNAINKKQKKVPSSNLLKDPGGE